MAPPLQDQRVAELELHQDEIAAQGMAYPIFDSIAAVYLLDQIDIHALHERLHDGEGIMPGDAGLIRRLVPLIYAVDWPLELAEEGTALAQTLTQLSEALAADDLESATSLASAAHDAQHHFSSSVADWFDRHLMPVVEDPEQADQSDDDHGNGDDSDDHGNGDDDNDDSNDTHDDGHDHSHGE